MDVNGNNLKVAGIVVAIVLAASIVFGAVTFLLLYTNHSKADSRTITNALQDQSDLVTQKLVTSGIIDRKTKGVPFINKDSFLVVYEATVYAGIDTNDIEVEASNKEVTITIPHSRIHSISIPASSIDFYDRGLVLFRANKKQALKAVKIIEKHVKKDAKKSGILSAADTNAKNVIRALVSGLLDDRKLIIEYQKKE